MGPGLLLPRAFPCIAPPISGARAAYRVQGLVFKICKYIFIIRWWILDLCY